MAIGVPELILLLSTGVAPLAAAIFALVALWKIVKAQESIAESLRSIAVELRTNRPGPGEGRGKA